MVEEIVKLKGELLEKISHFSKSRLQEVLQFVDSLATSEKEEEDPLLKVAGCLSGSPLSAEEIEEELYGPDPA